MTQAALCQKKKICLHINCKPFYLFSYGQINFLWADFEYKLRSRFFDKSNQHWGQLQFPSRTKRAGHNQHPQPLKASPSHSRNEQWQAVTAWGAPQRKMGGECLCTSPEVREPESLCIQCLYCLQIPNVPNPTLSCHQQKKHSIVDRTAVLLSYYTPLYMGRESLAQNWRIDGAGRDLWKSARSNPC